MQAYYTPGLTAALFSPQAYLAEQQEKGITGYTYGMTWSTSVLNLGPKSISIPHDPFMRLPILRCYRDAMKTAETMAAACVSDETNQNLSNLQKLLLKWHWKLGHLGFQHLQWIGRQGWLGKVGERFGQTAVHPPKCGSCQFGKQERNPKAGSCREVDKQREGILSANKLSPGDLIFSDQYQSSTPGRVFG
jgi:hypothetical protein